jgi:DUF917 family protein
LIDLDAGGYRCIPSAEYEIFNFVPLKRLPLFIFSSKNFYVINDLKGKDVDYYLDNIYLMEREVINVLGYRNSGGDLKKHLPFGSLTFSIKVGKALEENNLENYMERLGKFRVLEKKVLDSERFYEGYLILNGNYKIYFKNEYMEVYEGEKKIVEYPDIIALVRDGRGLLSYEVEKGMEVELYFLENRWFRRVLESH